MLQFRHSEAHQHRSCSLTGCDIILLTSSVIRVLPAVRLLAHGNLSLDAYTFDLGTKPKRAWLEACKRLLSHCTLARDFEGVRVLRLYKRLVRAAVQIPLSLLTSVWYSSRRAKA